MYLNNLSILNFKNYNEAGLSFSPRINCFTGYNGSGKTNLLDAIYYLSFCKSFTNPVDSQNILHDKGFFIIQGNYKRNGIDEEIYCSMKRSHRKVFKRNKKEYRRLADHVGLYPLVLITPSDSSLILGGSDERRKFTDGVLAQYDKEYLANLIDYNKALQQRNALLKSFAEKNYFDSASLDIWSEQLIKQGTEIHRARKHLFGDFLPIFQEYYNFLTNKNEEVSINYDSQLNDAGMAQLLTGSLQKDRMLQHSTSGIHKDDLLFYIDGMPAKKFGSQGQQKSFLIALKLAQFEFTRKVKGYQPILIFDDIFDKLDDLRVKQLMKLVSGEKFGQIFVTDTSSERLKDVFSKIGVKSALYEIDNGKIISDAGITGDE